MKVAYGQRNFLQSLVGPRVARGRAEDFLKAAQEQVGVVVVLVAPDLHDVLAMSPDVGLGDVGGQPLGLQLPHLRAVEGIVRLEPVGLDHAVVGDYANSGRLGAVHDRRVRILVDRRKDQNFGSRGYGRLRLIILLDGAFVGTVRQQSHLRGKLLQVLPEIPFVLGPAGAVIDLRRKKCYRARDVRRGGGDAGDRRWIRAESRGNGAYGKAAKGDGNDGNRSDECSNCFRHPVSSPFRIELKFNTLPAISPLGVLGSCMKWPATAQLTFDHKPGTIVDRTQQLGSSTLVIIRTFPTVDHWYLPLGGNVSEKLQMFPLRALTPTCCRSYVADPGLGPYNESPPRPVAE